MNLYNYANNLERIFVNLKLLVGKSEGETRRFEVTNQFIVV